MPKVSPVIKTGFDFRQKEDDGSVVRSVSCSDGTAMMVDDGEASGFDCAKVIGLIKVNDARRKAQERFDMKCEFLGRSEVEWKEESAGLRMRLSRYDLFQNIMA